MPTSPALSDLITAEYLAEQKRLHADPRGYGGRGDKWCDAVTKLIQDNASDPGAGFSVLDYGCGQATLARAVLANLGKKPVNVCWRNYDPARKGFASMPTGPYDLVVCSDVLEHIEPEKIVAVLNHLRALTGGLLFTVISLVETAKTLSDGRQAHILLRDPEWWQLSMEGAGFEAVDHPVENPKPEKQIVQVWRPV